MRNIVLGVSGAALMFQALLGSEPIFGKSVSICETSAVSQPDDSPKVQTYKLNLRYDLGHAATLVVVLTVRDKGGEVITRSEWQFTEGKADWQFAVADALRDSSDLTYTFLPTANSGFGFNSDLKVVPLGSLADFLRDRRKIEESQKKPPPDF